MSEKTNHQIVRFVQKLAEKYPQQDIPELFTDVHIRVSQETGDVMAFDDDDNEITRIVVDEWINSPVETDKFFSDVADVLRQVIQEQETAQGEKSLLGIIEPYNYVLENEAGEHMAELYVVDDADTIIIGQDFMDGLDKELDDFIDNLLKKE
jgi:hypothetical protein